MSENASSVSAWIGLGGNLNDPTDTFLQALDALRAISGVTLEAVSSLYRTAPLGLVDQPDFLNAITRVRTQLSPVELLQCLLQIEADLGRVRTAQRFSPRLIDLDLLLYGDICVETPELTVPHPRMHQRRFVLEPLAELEGELRFPGGTMLGEWLDSCPAQSVEKIGRLVGSPEKPSRNRTPTP